MQILLYMYMGQVKCLNVLTWLESSRYHTRVDKSANFGLYLTEASSSHRLQRSFLIALLHSYKFDLLLICSQNYCLLEHFFLMCRLVSLY